MMKKYEQKIYSLLTLLLLLYLLATFAGDLHLWKFHAPISLPIATVFYLDLVIFTTYSIRHKQDKKEKK
ncbi:MAG: hypothetical protein ACI31W_03725 [Lactococcus sp.]